MSLSDDLKALAKDARKNSKRWFPDIYFDGALLPVHFHHAMGVGGEAGEVVDLYKKATRSGQLDMEHILRELPAEMADVFTYLILLADELDIDLIQAFHDKQAECEERWG